MIACFGELLIRLQAPSSEPILHSPRFDANFGGAEANVAVALSRLGRTSKLITVLPENALGEAALAYYRSHGVDCADVFWRKGRMGLYFSSQGAGHRRSSIVYDRQESVFSAFGFADVNWSRMLQGAVRLHVSGISLALGESSANATLSAVEVARDAGIPVSFDCNFRQQLWDKSDLDPGPTMAEIVQYADIMFGNFRDIGLLLGSEFTGHSPIEIRRSAEAAFSAFPNLRYIASTQRRIFSAREHSLSARVDVPDGGFQAGEQRLTDILDRVGSGDAFAAGFLDGIHDQLSPNAALDRGLALACLKHAIPGDASVIGRTELDQWTGGTSDIDR